MRLKSPFPMKKRAFLSFLCRRRDFRNPGNWLYRGRAPFLACQNRDPQEAIIVTAENHDDFDFLVQAKLAYSPTGDVPPLSYDESPFWARDWLSYDIDPVKVDLGGMLSGESHRFGQVRVDGEDDYFFIGVFDAPEWRVSVPLDRLPSRCFVQASCTLECYRKSDGLRLYFSGDFGSGGSWHGSGLGYYEDGALTMGVFLNPDCPSEGFLPLPYYESGQNTSFILNSSQIRIQLTIWSR